MPRRMFSFSKTIKIKPAEVPKVVSDYGLHIYRNIWHYSFNPEFWTNSFWLKKTDDSSRILYSKAHNEYSPLLIYTDDDEKCLLKEHNTILGAYKEKSDENRYIFWFLRTNSFQDFLAERSSKSSAPKKHFPSLESYDKFKSRISGGLEIKALDKEYFAEHFDAHKPPEHLCGQGIIDLFGVNNPGIDMKWLRTASLIHNNEVVAIAILVDDGKSINLENITAKRDPLSFGVFLCTELVKYCCTKGYYSFDAGVSGIYGGYKQKIFLNSREIYREKNSISRYFKFWKPGYTDKISKRLSR